MKFKVNYLRLIIAINMCYSRSVLGDFCRRQFSKVDLGHKKTTIATKFLSWVLHTVPDSPPHLSSKERGNEEEKGEKGAMSPPSENPGYAPGPAQCAGPMTKISLLFWSFCACGWTFKTDVCKKLQGQITIDIF